MTKTPPKDIGASVRARLLRLARERGEDFQLVLTRYANERLLFRLASSRHAQRFVLKGAALFTLWTGKPHRATRDLDLLGFGDPGVDHVRDVFAEVLALDVADDGVRFDPSSLAVGLIREEQEYGGVRVEFVARITNAQVRLQVDVGFGDAITPEAERRRLPAAARLPGAAPARLSARDRRRGEARGDGAARHGQQPNEGLLRRRRARAGLRLRRCAARPRDPRDLRAPEDGAADDDAGRAHGRVRRGPHEEDAVVRLRAQGWGPRPPLTLAETIAAIRTFVAPPLLAAATATPPPATWRPPHGWT
jgi:hypothetical protein